MATQSTFRLIVSMTSYPARISGVSDALQSILNQTRLPNEIILWLGQDKFPNQIADLPCNLQQLVEKEKISIKWRKDIGPHTKYFYAFKEYQDAVVITVDDDIIYPNDMIENLYQSYLRFPQAVSALRVRLIGLSGNGEFASFNDWLGEISSYPKIPSMSLLAEGVGGVLYPIKLFNGVNDLLDLETIDEICRSNDDLWLKVMQLIAGVPVVVADGYQGLSYIRGSQECGLWRTYNSRGGTDYEWRKIHEKVDGHYGAGFLLKKITCNHPLKQ